MYSRVQLGAAVYLSLDITSQTRGCLGKHIYDCTYTELYWFIRIANVEQPLFYFCVFCIKLSVAFANRRITGLASRKWTITHWVFIAIFLVLLPTTVCLQAFQCVPVPARYSLIYIGSMADPHDFKCINTTAVSLATRVLHITTDVALLCVPIIILARLQMSIKRKSRLIFIFALGGMSMIASILRNLGVLRYSDDITWDYHDVYVWNTIDISFAVVVASLPSLNSLIDVGYSNMKNLRGYYNSNISGGRFRKYWRSKASRGDTSGSGTVVGLHDFPYQGMTSAEAFVGRETSSESKTGRIQSP